jgi:hypothetical protein
MKPCPVCESGETMPTVRRARLPVLQNRVYATRDEALRSPTAGFELRTCTVCGFSFNGAFRSDLVVYDEHYDNDVPSATFMRYYDDLARRLIERFNLTEGTIYDVGCGKGTFLDVLCRMAPGIRGVGVDPSCTPTTTGNFRLIKDVFRPELVESDARLVLLRHVLEHIEQPVPLLTQLAVAAPRAPLFVEVPDVNWIFANGAFWDFCYEHCNYFTPASLAYALTQAGYEIQEQLSLFSGQFQAIIGAPAASRGLSSRFPATNAVEIASAYAATESVRMRTAREHVEKAGNAAVLWGMATKGVVFAALMPASLAGGVDVNPKKQNRFAPGSGLRINPPEWVVSLGEAPTIFIMNGNYAHEIRRAASDLGVAARFVEL